MHGHLEQKIGFSKEKQTISALLPLMLRPEEHTQRDALLHSIFMAYKQNMGRLNVGKNLVGTSYPEDSLPITDHYWKVNL